MENEDALLGRYVKIQKAERKTAGDVEVMLLYEGPLRKAVEQDVHGNSNDPEYFFRRRMSVNPDKLIQLAEDLRKRQEAHRKAHKELREFEAAHPEIVKIHRA